MSNKEKITLTKEQETLLVPLYSKAQPNPVIQDEKARQILTSVQYDFQKLKIPQKTEVTLRIRARQLDIWTEQFIQSHPDALVIHLGCGLDSRCQRVQRADSLWIDLDLPDVIALRQKFYEEGERYRMIASSVTDLEWVDLVAAEGRPVLVVAEGLLMYLAESDVKELVRRLHAAFPGSTLIFDAFSLMTVQRIQAHPSLQKTGATIRWGIDDPHEMESWAEGIQLKEEWFFSQSADINKLSPFYRWMFRLTGSLMAVQRAQRLLYFEL